MWMWVPIITVDVETCENCDSELACNSKAYLKVWWPYKDKPEKEYLLCTKCGPQPS